MHSRNKPSNFHAGVLLAMSMVALLLILFRFSVTQDHTGRYISNSLTNESDLTPFLLNSQNQDEVQRAISAFRMRVKRASLEEFMAAIQATLPSKGLPDTYRQIVLHSIDKNPSMAVGALDAMWGAGVYENIDNEDRLYIVSIIKILHSKGYSVNFDLQEE